MSPTAATEPAARRAEPKTARFVPTRAGVINVWDYRDDEFAFADGWLVLRGPNGSGKTKALEVLFPFVLDGRIEPRRLNPFASEERTMKSNLLYRGQESAYGYVWMEFVRGDDTATGEAVTIGVGLRAQKHSDKVTRWYFVTDGRVGIDFSLLTADDRPLTKKQLKAEIGDTAIHETPADYRAAVDARLYGLGRERFEQLLTLVLTLRRPQLAKNLDPVKLSDTLADGLRPLDDHLLAEAARSFDDMETVQRTLDGLVQADTAAKAFLATYTTYLRTHARAAADALSRRRSDVQSCRHDLVAAVAGRRDAERRKQAAADRLQRAELAEATARAHLENLKLSSAYHAHQQLADLERLVRQIGQASEQAAAELTKRAKAAGERAEELRAAETTLSRLDGELSRLAGALGADAADAGIPWTAEDAAPDGLIERVGARTAARRDDVQQVRQAVTDLRRAEHDRDTAGTALARAEQAAHKAEDAERAAAAQVEAARQEARQRLANWVERHAATVSELDISGLLDALLTALDGVGEPDTPDLRTVFTQHTGDAVHGYRDELVRLRADRNRLAEERTAVEAQRRMIAAERDDAPAAFAARSAHRDGRAGAPLWRLVRFADDLPEHQAAAIEAALEAANLLDAWLHPEDETTASALSSGEADGYLLPLPRDRRPVGPTLATVLVPEQQDAVPAARITAALESIALVDVVDALIDAPAVSVSGQFAQGVQVGGHTKAAAEFVGATARARRRAARLADCDRRIAALTEQLDDVERLVGRTQTVLDAVRAAETELPRTGRISEALRRHIAAAGALSATRQAVDGARAVLDQAIAEVGARDRALRTTAADRAVPADRIDEVAGAVERFQRSAQRLIGKREQVQNQRAAVAGALVRVEQARDEASDARRQAAETERQHAQESTALQTLHDSVGAEAEQVLARVRTAERDLQSAEGAVTAAHAAATDAEGALGRAETAETATVTALHVALREEQSEARGLAPYVHPDLLALMRCPTDLTWPAQSADWLPPERTAQALVAAAADAEAGSAAAETLPSSVVALHEAVLSTTKDLTPSEASLKQSRTRVSNALSDLQAQLSAAGHDYHPEWDTADDVIMVRVADEHGLAPVGVFAERIAEARRDQEQLLTESERRILEDGLLTQLAKQIHERTVEARDLIRGMNREMRARRMSSGVAIGVRWELADSLDEEQRAVSKLLDRDAASLGPDDLARMRRHFASRIKTARAGRPDRSYRELLADVLDYRRWRTFAFTLHRADGGEDRLTRARHSQLSGGEQSVSLHLPLFAAAHAMLTSARSTSPRLLALDEAFAGVDDNGRTELMGLAAQFGFDLFMTGYDLWATYATVRKAAHYDLSHSPTEHTVSALLMVWEGSEVTTDIDGELLAALGSPGRRRRLQQHGGGLLDDVEPGTDDEQESAVE